MEKFLKKIDSSSLPSNGVPEARLRRSGGASLARPAGRGGKRPASGPSGGGGWIARRPETPDHGVQHEDGMEEGKQEEKRPGAAARGEEKLLKGRATCKIQ